MSEKAGSKQINYFSVEYLIGRLLFDTLTNLQMVETARSALTSLGVDLDRLRKLEPDAALGNGGLGRLAACFMDSMSTLGVPAYGYGIRYDHGLFRQQIRDGAQHESLTTGYRSAIPWEFERPELEYSVCFGGSVEYVGTDLADTEGTLVSGRARARCRVRHATGRLARPPCQCAAAVVGARHRIHCIYPPSTGATMSAPWPPRAGRSDFARALSERRDTSPDRSCGFGRNIFSPRHRCRTLCSAT